jgi:hypothetical protein
MQLKRINPACAIAANTRSSVVSNECADKVSRMSASFMIPLLLDVDRQLATRLARGEHTVGVVPKPGSARPMPQSEGDAKENRPER